MGRVTVCAEANTSASETFKGTEGRIVAGFPRIPYLKRRLPLVHVTRAVNPVPPVNFMTTVSAVSTDQTIQAGSDRFHRILGFNEYPNLNHVARFPVIRRVGKTRRDNDSFGVFMENEAIHNTPPTMNSATMSEKTTNTNAASAINARADSRDFRDFMIQRVQCMVRSISICSSPQIPTPSASVMRYQMKEPGEFRLSRRAWAMRARIAAATVR